MPTRNEKKRAFLMREIKAIQDKISPLQRKEAYLKGELALLNEYEHPGSQDTHENKE